MNSIPTVQALLRGRLALIVAGVFVLLGLAASPAQAGYYGGYGYGGYGYGGYGGPCSYRCGYRPYYPIYRRHYGCCGPHLIYERRFVEREYVERRYGYGFRRHYGCYSYDRCHAGYYGGYGRPLGYGYGGGYGAPYGYGGVGRRWPLPFPAGYEAYDDAPRPPAPVYYGEE
jgi:hypothetical protein